MAEKTIFDTFGRIAKEESVNTYKTKSLSNVFVLETTESYPGYHGANLPEVVKPSFLYLVTGQNYTAEKIMRVSARIRQYFHQAFDAVSASVFLANNRYDCVRLRGLSGDDIVPELVSCYTDEGVVFRKPKNISGKAIINIEKPFYLETTDGQLFRDLDDPHVFYLRLPGVLNWKLFARVTESVKNNVDNNNFDAALGAFFGREVMDVVRVFGPGLTPERLHQIHERYRLELK